jgi:hypothetical protein
LEKKGLESDFLYLKVWKPPLILPFSLKSAWTTVGEDTPIMHQKVIEFLNVPLCPGGYSARGLKVSFHFLLTRVPEQNILTY